MTPHSERGTRTPSRGYKRKVIKLQGENTQLRLQKEATEARALEAEKERDRLVNHIAAYCTRGEVWSCNFCPADLDGTCPGEQGLTAADCPRIIEAWAAQAAGEVPT